MTGEGTGVRPQGDRPCGLVGSRQRGAIIDGRSVLEGQPMSKRTNKKKTNARRKKANHGRKPNAGRNS